jgi:hypothetical protein
MSKDVNKAICQQFISRSKALGYKGKKRDAAAMDFLCGAWAALEAAGRTEEAQHLGAVATMLIAPRGYSEVEAIAALD